MLFWAVLLTAVSSLELSDGAPAQPLHAKRSPPPCDQRCRKIFDKTLQRVSYSFDAIEKLAGRLNYFDDRLSKEICWRAFDFFHCMDHCEEPEKQSFSEMRNALQSSCQERAAEERASFSCISRYHNFLEIHCSSYMNEAIAQQNVVIFDEEHRHLMCKYLREHQQCLVTNVAQYCPKATHLFIEKNLGDYFPTFVADSGERYLDEQLVDDCRSYKFHFELKPEKDTHPRIVLTPPPRGQFVPDFDNGQPTTLPFAPVVIVIPNEDEFQEATDIVPSVPVDDSVGDNQLPTVHILTTSTEAPLFISSYQPHQPVLSSTTLSLPPAPSLPESSFTPQPAEGTTTTESPAVIAPVIVHFPTFPPINQDGYSTDQGERDQTDRSAVIATYLLISIAVFIVLLLLLVVLFGRVIRRLLDTLISELID